MRVKWNRHLDGVRPLITVPETDVIRNNDHNKSSFTDLNDNTTNDNDSQTINPIKLRNCDSPSPSSASISSKRSDRSKTRISNLFGLFKVKDKVMIDNNNEDSVSNYSQLSSPTIPMHSVAKRKSSSQSSDSPISGHDKIGFEADTRRRRRANTLLLKSSMRRSWQQLNGQTKSVSTGYLIVKEPNLNIYNYSPVISLPRKVSQNRATTDQTPEVESNSDSKTAEDINKTCSQINPNREVVIDEVRSNGMFVKTDEQIVINECITPSNLNEIFLNGCDLVVENVTISENWSDSERIDPKNGYKTEHKLSSDKTTNIELLNEICVTNANDILDLDSDKTDSININIVETTSVLTDKINHHVLSDKPNGINKDNVMKNDITKDSVSKNDITKDSVSKNNINKDNISKNSITKDVITEDSITKDITQYSITINDENKPNHSELSTPETEDFNSTEILISSNDTFVTTDIVKVKVKKNLLPEFEVVSFSSQITPSATSPINCNNEEAVVVTFIDDEPMTRERGISRSPERGISRSSERGISRSSERGISRSPERGTTKSPEREATKSTRGILRLRSHKDSNSEDTSSDSNTKISQKKVHFADSCLHSTRTSRGLRRPIKSRHYGSYGVVASINDKKATNRRPTQANSANALASKRVTKINASTITKRDVRSAQLIDDKHQIQNLTELCECKTKQLKTLCLDQNYIRLAFDSLSVVIQHLIEQYAPFENPKLKQALQNANKRCEQLKDNLDAKDLELSDMKIIYEEQINQLMKEREKNYSDLNQAKVNHEANVKKLHQIHSWELKTLQDKHNRELEICQQNRNQLLNEIEDSKSQLNQTKQLKDALESKINQIEENIMNDKDKKFKYLTEKTKQLELEVDSLKVVMDMKNEKIHTLERQMIETQEKINELPMAKETIRGLQQQIENLQVTLERKIHQFNQLTREHEDLKNEYDREMREKRRLSMKNEELAYHLSESFHNESGLSNSTNFESSNPWKSPALITDETPIKTNRAFIASASASASSRKTHSKVIKSMSTSMSAKRTTPAIYCRSSNSVSDNENSFLSNGTADEVFDGRCVNMSLDSGRKSNVYGVSDERPPQCILDSGFEEIQGLNSLPK